MARRSQPSLEQPSLELGTMVADRYRLGRILGVGGMGEVFEAEHVASGVRVAIKLLRESASETIEERFGREGRALAQLHSEHVIKVFDAGILASGRPFIVMELLQGSDLAVVLKQRGHMPFERAVRDVLEATIGLAEAHGLGIVHRDLKPANLFRATVGERAVVKVLDFGISKVNSAAKAGKTGLTEAGDVFGSPRYMSPEQLRASRDVDGRADIWSLGVTLSELVTGVTPFHADDFGTLLFNILEAKPPSIAHIHPELDRVVQTCLAQDPNHRFDGLVSFAEALAPLIEEGPALAARVRTTFDDAARRALQLEGRAAPTVTRVLDPPPEHRTTAVFRITLAPIAATVSALPVGVATTAPAKRLPRQATWLGAAAISTALVLTGIALVVSSNSFRQRQDEDEPRSTRGPKNPPNEEPDVPSSAIPRERALGPEVASQATFRVAPAIGKLLAETRGTERIDVREMLFFEDRAVLLVGPVKALERYDYARGRLSAPSASQVTSGARRAERIPLVELDLSVVPRIAELAAARFGAGKLHSVALHWIAEEVLWVAASQTGDVLRFHLDGRPHAG